MSNTTGVWGVRPVRRPVAAGSAHGADVHQCPGGVVSSRARDRWTLTQVLVEQVGGVDVDRLGSDVRRVTIEEPRQIDASAHRVGPGLSSPVAFKRHVFNAGMPVQFSRPDEHQLLRLRQAEDIRPRGRVSRRFVEFHIDRDTDRGARIGSF
jgi:hypothetical protein